MRRAYGDMTVRCEKTDMPAMSGMSFPFH